MSNKCQICQNCKNKNNIKSEAKDTKYTIDTIEDIAASSYLWTNSTTLIFFIVMHIILNLNYKFIEIPIFKKLNLNKYYKYYSHNTHIKPCFFPPSDFISLSGDKNTKYGKYYYGTLFTLFSIIKFISNYTLWKKIENKLDKNWKKFYYPIYLSLSGLSSLLWTLQSTFFLYNYDQKNSLLSKIHENLALIATIIDCINLIILLICLKSNNIISTFNISILILILLIIPIIKLLVIPGKIIPYTLGNYLCMNGFSQLLLLFSIYLIQFLIIPLSVQKYDLYNS